MQSPKRVPFVEPLALSKLDSDGKAMHAFLALLDVRERSAAGQKPARKLKEHGAQFASLAQGLERITEQVPGLVDNLRRSFFHV